MVDRTEKQSYPKADWQSLRVSLDRCYEGKPVGKCGTFPGTVLTLCQLQHGTLDMHRDGLSIQTNASHRPWIINSPGERTQIFSEDAHIISIHLSLGNPGNGAEWIGPPMVKVQPDTPARLALVRLIEHSQAAGISPQQLEVRGMPLALPIALSLRVAATELFIHMTRLCHTLGMRYEVPNIVDERVRKSHRQLAMMPMHIRFSRTQLASDTGLTAGQLDRLWRKELGLTPKQYRQRQRLAFACEQLRLPDVSIKAVAADLGFHHLSQFSNWFSTQHNESPRSFRNRPGSS